MADEPSQDEKTEEPSDERRQQYRDRGQVAVSREITSVAVLVGAVIFLTFYLPIIYENLRGMFTTHFQAISHRRIGPNNVLDYAFRTWTQVLWVVAPMLVVTVIMAVTSTFTQTKMNFSWKRLKPNFQKFNVIKGLGRMVSGQAAMELLKGIGKLTAVAVVSYLILRSEWTKVPGLLNYPIGHIWSYWGRITQYLFWAVSAMLLLIAGIDYIYNYMSLEKKMKMTKKEVKDEHKQREVDPQLKEKMRKMQRDMTARKALDETQKATVLVTNPTHYSVALKYELGMGAPVMVAKGVDYLALRMRETARDADVPIVENRPLARELYATLEPGEEVPERFFKAVAEVIRYVFQMKGKPLSQSEGSESSAPTDQTS